MTARAGWTSWSLDPLVLAGLAAAAWLYARGLGTLWRPGPGRGVARWRAGAFGAGLLATFVALVGPLDALAEELLTAHMVQHLLLMLVAAPLLVAGSPVLALSQALSPASRRTLRTMGRGAAGRAARALLHPLWVWLAAAAALFAWHAPALYRASVAHDAVHVLQHATFFGTALLFWWTALQPSGRRRLARGGDVLFVLGGAMQGGVLGALFVFAEQPLYPFYAAGAAAWGLIPLQDQQLAGLVMWVPSFAVYLAVASALFLGWLRAADREALRVDARIERSRVGAAR